MAPYGRALLDFLEGAEASAFTVRRDDGFAVEMPASHFFRSPAEFTAIERAALDACRDRVLDVGAGAGIHTLELQRRGVEVTAIDVCPGSVAVMSRRGVREVHETDVRDFSGGPFHAILVLGRGIGMAGTLDGLELLLRKLASLLADGGGILCDSVDVRATEDPRHLAYHDASRRAGRYIGETRIRFECGNRVGEWTGWLHVDPETLAARARRAGLGCEIVLASADGEYLARLAPAG